MTEEEKKEEVKEEEAEEVTSKPEESKKEKKKGMDGKTQFLLMGGAILFVIYLTFFVSTVAEPAVFGLKPAYFILLISVGLSLFVTIVYKLLTDQALLHEYRDQIKKYQAQMKDFKDEPEKMGEVNKKAMEVNMKMMKQNLKPMLVTILPFFAIFGWLRGVYDSTLVIPLSFHVPLSGLATGLGWIGTYIIFSMIFTTVFRKLMKVV